MSRGEQSSAQVVKGLLDTLVLLVLEEGDNYGFGILHELESRYGPDGDILREATLYPLLHRLEAGGFVKSYWRPGKRGTDRKYYRVTAPGRDRLKERIDDWRKVARILRRVEREYGGDPG